MAVKKSKIQQAESRLVLRSQIKLAEYNPRRISEDARKALKANLKRLGLMGGIIWNEDTGNLVGGHQKVQIIDEVNRYNPDTKENDYEIRVEVVHLSEKEEMEQNMFLNNKAVQGDFDDDLLRNVLRQIDHTAAGFNDFDLDMLGITPIDDDEFRNITDIPEESDTSNDWRKGNLTQDNEHLAQVDANTHGSEENTKIDRSVDFYNDTPENQIARHNEIQKVKDRINKKSDTNNDGGMLSYFIVSFPNPQETQGALIQLGFDPNSKFVDGKELMDKIDILE
ncbi:MAG: hypothetical protein IJ640_10295 [Prevotella sp.]|nr:hypothetical protein [Prevotella sp.]